MSLGEIKQLEQSDVVLVHTTIASVDNANLQQSLLCKHVDVPSQKARISKTDEKWAISVRSFQNEYAFFSRGADGGGSVVVGGAAKLQVPRCFYRSREPSDERLPLERSTLLLEYLAPEAYEQHQDLTWAQAQAALTALARFHAFYWDGKDQDRTPTRGLFERGGWWRAELRPSVKFETMVESFESLCANFPAEFGDLDNAESRALLGKLQAYYKELGVQLRAKGDRTLMHGDCKTSNLFFSRGTGQCALIDFQWTGAASSGGGDVAYLLWSGVEPAAIVEEGQEAALLDHYYEALVAALPFDSPRAAYTRAEWQCDYELELLDVLKTCLPQLLNGLTPEDCQTNLGAFGWLTHEYHPSVTRAFVGRALAALRTWEPGAARVS